MIAPDKLFKISELFVSLEGEARYTSHPTVYLRYAMCNLKCPMFNNHNKQIEDSGYATLTFDPKQYTTLSSLPTIETGCDSQYAVNPEFSHLWKFMTTDQLADALTELAPRGQWIHPATGLPVILSLTGGEPMLNARWFVDLLNHPKLQRLRHVLIETNCTVPVSEQVAADILYWLAQNPNRKWTWSNSPKLSASGESYSKVIKPAVALSQLLGTIEHPGIEQYFKFVVGPSTEQFDEVCSTMEYYTSKGVPTSSPIWIMPEACTTEQQNDIAQQVAQMCLDRGYLFSYRLQNALWGNQVGT